MLTLARYLCAGFGGGAGWPGRLEQFELERRAPWKYKFSLVFFVVVLVWNEPSAAGMPRLPSVAKFSSPRAPVGVAVIDSTIDVETMRWRLRHGAPNPSGVCPKSFNRYADEVLVNDTRLVGVGRHIIGIIKVSAFQRNFLHADISPQLPSLRTAHGSNRDETGHDESDSHQRQYERVDTDRRVQPPHPVAWGKLFWFCAFGLAFVFSAVAGWLCVCRERVALGILISLGSWAFAKLALGALRHGPPWAWVLQYQDEPNDTHYAQT